MSGAVIEIIQPKGKNAEGEEEAPVVLARAVYEHPFLVRLCHWINAVALFVMVGSGLQIFRAFPSFGAKIPENDLLHWPKAFAIGGWLGGALQWHLTFMWIYIATGLFYIGYQIFSGNYRQVLFTHRDIPGVWPMVKHYFFFGPKPPVREAYNPLQKHAYTTAIGLGVLSVLTGLVVWKPVQFSWLGWMMGGFHYARIWHFAVMWAILFFVLGHLVMVILHGWNNFVSMLTGWKKDPEYLFRTIQRLKASLKERTPAARLKACPDTNRRSARHESAEAEMRIRVWLQPYRSQHNRDGL